MNTPLDRLKGGKPSTYQTALDGFSSTVDRSGTGTGRDGTETGKLPYRFAPNGSRFLPFLRNGYKSKSFRFYRSFPVQIRDLFQEKLTKLSPINHHFEL